MRVPVEPRSPWPGTLSAASELTDGHAPALARLCIGLTLATPPDTAPPSSSLCSTASRPSIGTRRPMKQERRYVPCCARRPPWQAS